MKTIIGTDKDIIAQIDGNDIVVRNVLVTAFGYNDPGDNGECASGKKNGPDLMGCALPVLASVAETRPSPLAFLKHIPWGTPVKFWQGDEDLPAHSVMTTLEDDGPDVKDYPTHGGDLCVAPASVFAPKIALEQLSRKFSATLSYRIIAGAKYVPPQLIHDDDMPAALVAHLLVANVSSRVTDDRPWWKKLLGV